MMQEQIKQAIEANLPKAVGEVLQQRLAKADKDEAALKEAQTRISKLCNDLQEKTEEAFRAQEQLKAHGHLSTREAEIEARERNLQIELLKVRLSESDASKEFARSVALGLVRNIEFREVLKTSESTQIPVTNGGYTNLQTVCSSDSKESTKQAI